MNVKSSPLLLTRVLTDRDLDFLVFCEKNYFINPWSECMLKEHLSKPLMSLNLGIIDCNNPKRLLGYILSTIVANEASLEKILILPNCRRKRLGMRLMANWLLYFEDQPKFKEIFLEMRENDLRAKAFYESLHFKVIGLRKDYYAQTDRPDENALIFKGNRLTVLKAIQTRL